MIFKLEVWSIIRWCVLPRLLDRLSVPSCVSSMISCWEPPVKGTPITAIRDLLYVFSSANTGSDNWGTPPKLTLPALIDAGCGICLYNCEFVLSWVFVTRPDSSEISCKILPFCTIRIFWRWRWWSTILCLATSYMFFFPLLVLGGELHFPISFSNWN